MNSSPTHKIVIWLVASLILLVLKRFFRPFGPLLKHNAFNSLLPEVPNGCKVTDMASCSHS